MYKSNTYFFAFLLITSLFSLYAEPGNSLEEQLKEAQAYEKLDILLRALPSDKILELKILEEKRKIVASLLGVDDPPKTASMPIEHNNNNQSRFEAEAHFFKPKPPIALTDEVKKRPVVDRIKDKFIGDIPAPVISAINYFDNQEEYDTKKIKAPKTILFYGEPGTGKTHLVKAMAQELEIATLSFSASFFADKYIGEASRKIRKAFESAKALNKPVIIFIDEIDAIGTKRKDSTHNEHRATLMTLLTEIQELQDNKNILVIVATNDLESLDSAVVDRFPAKSHIEPLAEAQRKEFFSKLFKDEDIPQNPELIERLVIATKKYECKVEADSEKHLHPSDQKENWKDCWFSNRDMRYLAITAKERQFSDCKSNPKNCTRSLCSYFSEVMSEIGKTGNNARNRTSLNCNGLK